MTLNNRKTRKLYATFIRTKNPWITNEAFRKMIKENNLEVKTLTLDNGIEFERIGLLAKQMNLKEDQMNTLVGWFVELERKAQTSI